MHAEVPEVRPASAGETSQRDPGSRASLIVALFALGFTGVSGQLWGRLWATLSLAPILLPTWLLARRLRRGRGFLAVAGGVVVALVVVTTALADRDSGGGGNRTRQTPRVRRDARPTCEVVATVAL